ncbi:creatininase family protein [Kitasatospora sp. NBC_01250]|uniref:creatininase family protein n=1 Tax=Kitasatospora sp. NBC_01250 TaxID=2903571 RepID=UPI002E365272|nr:creatininase family protein [Kitasatospora sp. NBC_01250]
MTPAAATARQYGRLAAPVVAAELGAGSVLCLPIGSVEQHGPHLPLNTDTVIAEQFTTRLVERYGDHHDLWALPAIPYGLSLEHIWSPGTVSLRVASFMSLLDAVVGGYVRSTPARTLLIVNGHGGNRGVLEAALYELQDRYALRACVIHPSSLSGFRTEGELPEIHAGHRETSLMLTLAPEDVHLDRLPVDFTADEERRGEINRLVLDRGVTWPWNSGDSAIAACGVIGGDPREASADIGHRVIESALDSAADVLAQLLLNCPQRPAFVRSSHGPHPC